MLEASRSEGFPMSSEPCVATVENASGVEGSPAQGGANLPRSSMSPSAPQAAESDDEPNPPSFSNSSSPVSEVRNVSGRSANYFVDYGNLTTLKPSKLLQNEVPEPAGDPFEYLLKLMRDKDTVQCTAWKDEVQNILIFAGLFSAVVTAFIIASYPRLQPGANDAIVGLLAHIADRLDNSPNKTESISSIIANTGFSPSRSDININVFWFISLVLSLTAALTGIITLQWLREHQRYDSSLKPRETMAVLNARLHSFKQWYVPQIFAGLPLLLQGALILFFAGMIEFLFALRLEVAIPVTLAICVPLIFLIATTILPFLQVCILQDPFRLSINNTVPSPCPYKSPQSLIARRIGLNSHTAFMFFSSMVAGAYICVIKIACFIRKRPPIFHSQRPNLKLRLRDELPQRVSRVGNVSCDWTSFDASWLNARSIYAMSLQMVHRDENDLAVPRTVRWRSSFFIPELYDCTSCFHEILHQNRADENLVGALCDCMVALCAQAVHDFRNLALWSNMTGDSEYLTLLRTDLCFAFGRLACNDLDVTNSPITAAFIDDVIRHESSDNLQTTAKTLPTAFMASWAFTINNIWGSEPAVWARQRQLARQILVNRLEIGPERLFPMTSDELWLPRQVLHYIGNSLAEESSRHVTPQKFIAFLKSCSSMQPNSQWVIRPAPATKAYGGISAYMKAIVSIAGNNLAHLTQLCDSNGPQNLIHEKPFLLIAACFYLDAATRVGVGRDRSVSLLEVIIRSCGTTEGNLSRDTILHYHTLTSGWSGLDDAINAIYNHHNSSHQPTSNANSAASPANPNGHDDNV